MNAHAHRTRAALATALALVGAGLVATTSPTAVAADLPPSVSCAPVTFSRTDLGLGASTGGGSVAGPIGQVVGDLDGDGDLDIAAVSETTYDVSVLKGDGHGSFAAPINLAGGQAPAGIAGGDFNGDGIVDTVTATHFPNQLEVRLGPVVDDSLGSSNLNTGDSWISAVTTGDFDDDGDLDIAGLSGGTVYVFAGNGNGGFAAPVGHAVGGDGVALATGDVDADGRADLVAGNYRDATVSVLRQTDGGFATPQVVPMPEPGGLATAVVTGVASADVDGDGRDDLLAVDVVGSGTFGNVHVALGRPGGGFAVSNSVKVGSHPESIAAADLNHDGRTDVVVGLRGRSDVTALFGDGDGFFSSRMDYPVGSAPRGVTAADVDDDGLTDLAVAASGSSTLALLRNTSRTDNLAPVGRDLSWSAQGGRPLDVGAPGLLEGASDADCDVLVARLVEAPAHGTATIRRDGSFSYVPADGYLGSDSFRFAVDDGFSPVEHTVSLNVTTIDAVEDEGTFTEGETRHVDVLGNDTNSDGSPLAISSVSQPEHGTVVVDAGGGGLSFTPQPRYIGPANFTYTVTDGHGHTATGRVALTILTARGCVEAAFAPVRSVTLPSVDRSGLPTIADFDGDGDSDIAVPGPVTRMSLLEGDGAGGFQVSQTGKTSTTGNDGAAAATATADFNEDGLPDLLTTNGGEIQTGLWLGQASGPLLAGTGMFTPRLSSPELAGVGDVNEDGHVDALLSDGGTLDLRLGDGHGGLVPGRDLFDAASGSMVVRDVNGDGHLDIVGYGLSERGDYVGVSLGDGTGGFAPETWTRSGVHTLGVSAGDFTGDGVTDLATVNVGTDNLNDVTMLAGDGSGHFTVVDTVPLGYNQISTNGPARVESGDFNGDGRSDVVVGDAVHGRVLLLQSRGPGGFAPPRVLASPGRYWAWQLAVGDVDGNRSPDLVLTTSDFTDQVQILANECVMPPVATDDAWTTAEDTALTIGGRGVLDNDVPAEATATVATGPAHGTLSLASDGSFTYTPAADFNGADSFTYKVTSAGGTDVGKVNLTVTPVNDRPTVADDTAAVLKDSSANRIAVLGNDSDVDGDAIAVSVVTRPAHGTAAVVPGGAAVTYTPTRGYTGADSFTYTVTDGHGGLATATVRLTVAAVNRPPKVKADSAKVLMNSSGTSILVLANDSDPDKDPLKVVSTSGPAHGTVTIPSGGARVIYTPSPGYLGTDTFTYTVSDGRGGTATASVKVSVVRR